MLMLKIGDRVVDIYVEQAFGRTWAGTVAGVGRQVVQVVWDCDKDSGWVDTAYISELRLINEESDEQFV